MQVLYLVPWPDDTTLHADEVIAGFIPAVQRLLSPEENWNGLQDPEEGWTGFRAFATGDFAR